MFNLITIFFFFFFNYSVFFLNNLYLNLLCLFVILLFLTNNFKQFYLISYNDMIDWRVFVYFTLLINLWFSLFIRYSQTVLFYMLKLLNTINSYFYNVFYNSFYNKLSLNYLILFLKKRLNSLSAHSSIISSSTNNNA